MKISTFLLSAVVVAISLVATISQTAPLTSVKTKSFNALQECLHFPSSSSVKTSFCYRLLNPSHTSTDNLTSSELTLRYVFFTEAATIWSLYKKWSECTQRTLYSDKSKCKPRLSDYKGLFLKDFKADKFQLVNLFESYAAMVVNPMKDEAKHCMLFHGSDNTRQLLPKYEKGCTAYAHLSWENVQQTDMLDHFLPTWRRETYIRHGIKASAWREFNAKLKEFKDEEAFFDCLYSTTPRNSGYQKDLCRSIVNLGLTELASDFSSSNGVSLDDIGRMGKHYVAFVRSNIVYDCLKYHRTERVHSCENVFKRVPNFWNKECAQNDKVIKKTLMRLKAEEDLELKRVEDAAKYLPFIALPKRLAKLCELYSIDGEKVKHTRPLDCEEGGLYYPLL